MASTEIAAAHEPNAHQPPTVSRANSKPKGILKNAPPSTPGGTQQ